MKYSILNSAKQQRLILGKEIENSYIDWDIDKSLNQAFEEYRASYILKNDISIFDTSYFNVLCDLFYEEDFSFTKFNLSNTLSHFENHIFSNCLRSYQNEGIPKDSLVLDEISELNNINQLMFPNSDKSLKSLKSHLSSENIKEESFFLNEENDLYTLTENFYDKCNDLATKDIETIESYKSQILERNPIILNEFKDFIVGFHDYIIELIPEQYSKFKTYFTVLEEDMQFFKNTQIHSLSKYKFVIGGSSRRNSGARGNIDNFIPAGTCYYGDKVFINSYSMTKKDGSVWFKRNIKHIFYHEIGHTLDYMYFNDVVLKDGIKRERSSHNEEFKKICKKNYAKFRFFKSYLPKKYANWLAYYIAPAINKNKVYQVIPKTIDPFTEQLNSDFNEDFSDLISPSQIIHQVPNPKNFSSKMNTRYYTLDFSRPLSESWAESFSFIFSWLKDGFSEYDKFSIKAGRSHDRALIKMQYNCMIYLLENFDWSKLNISYAVYLKRKTHIKKYLKHIKDMPLFISKKKNKESRKKVYLTYHDLIKNR